MKCILTATFAAGLALSAAPALANISLVGGTGSSGFIPAVADENDFLDNYGAGFGLSNPLGGFFSAQLTGSASAYRFDFFGGEGSATNTFTVGSEVFSHSGGTSFTGSVLDSFVASTLDFDLETDIGTANPSVVTNREDGSGVNSGADLTNFFVSFGDENTTSGRVVWVFFDDSGAANDDNHDDLVVRISAVPLPPAVLLLGLGLAGFGGVRRMQARRKAA